MKKYYILINPFTFKPIEFSEFIKEDVKVAHSSTDLNGNREFNFEPALCIEIDNVDELLLSKTYNPSLSTFE